MFTTSHNNSPSLLLTAFPPKVNQLQFPLPIHASSPSPSSSSNQREEYLHFPSFSPYRINLIDTPGHVDFTLEVEKSLRVLDGAVVVLDASAGVEAQTLTVWHQATKMETPCVAFINKMDKNNADLEKSLKSIRQKLNMTPILMQVRKSMTLFGNHFLSICYPIVNLVTNLAYFVNS